MSTILSSSQPPSAVPAHSIVQCPADVTSSPSTSPLVSAVRQAEDRLDRHIDDLGHKAVHASAAGDKAKARDLVDQMYAAIRSRSQQHQDRLARERLADVERRLDEGVDYFQTRGRIDREAVEGRIA